jgi:1-acyl-sn-glycerol-3-phosphate acyltransferase
VSRRVLKLKPQVYLDDRPPERFGWLYEYSRTHRPDWVYDIARLLLMPVCAIVFRARVVDIARVPGSGAVILAPNHFSTMDHFFCGIYLRRRVRFMAKSQLFRGPLEWILRHGGAFPVQRGRRDEQSIATALEILREGGVIVIYPEGGRSRGESVQQHARPGVGRLALESGAAVVPVAIHGSLRARNWKRLEFPRVTVRYGEPVRFERLPGCGREQAQAVADEILAQVRAMYGQLGAIRETRRRSATALRRL